MKNLPYDLDTRPPLGSVSLLGSPLMDSECSVLLPVTYFPLDPLTEGLELAIPHETSLAFKEIRSPYPWTTHMGYTTD